MPGGRREPGAALSGARGALSRGGDRFDIVHERDALRLLRLADLTEADALAGSRAVLAAEVPAPTLGPEERSAFIGGPVRPAWAPASQGEVSVCRVADALWRPRFGAVGDASGRLFASTVREAQEGPKGLSALPRPGGGRVEAIASGAVFLPWGARFNYGHFLLDALPSLLAVEEAGLLGDRPALAPPLTRWQRDLLRLGFGERLALREVSTPAARIADAVFATSMDHHLNRPSRLLAPLRDRIRARAAALRKGRGPRRIYLSRRSHAHTMRVMVNEAALEQTLARRGFAIIRPERLTAAAQAAMMLDAEVIIGPTGAALANAALAATGARLVEIQPEIFVTDWAHAFSRILGVDYSLYFTPAPLPPQDVPLVRRMRRGFRFGYRLPLEDFLAFLDQRV